MPLATEILNSPALLVALLASGLVLVWWATTASATPAPAPAAKDSSARRAQAAASSMAAPARREYREAELAAFKGDGDGAILAAVDGIVFDFASAPGGRDFYGPGGGYHCFAGCDATLGLATMNLDPASWVRGTLASSLSFSQRDTLASWVDKFISKYAIRGCCVDGARPTTLAELEARLAK